MFYCLRKKKQPINVGIYELIWIKISVMIDTNFYFGY